MGGAFVRRVSIAGSPCVCVKLTDHQTGAAESKFGGGCYTLIVLLQRLVEASMREEGAGPLVRGGKWPGEPGPSEDTWGQNEEGLGSRCAAARGSLAEVVDARGSRHPKRAGLSKLSRQTQGFACRLRLPPCCGGRSGWSFPGEEFQGLRSGGSPS